MYIKQGKNRNLSNKTLLEITLTPKSNSKEKNITPKFWSENNYFYMKEKCAECIFICCVKY